MKLLTCVATIVIFQAYLGIGHGLPKSSAYTLLDTVSFDDKHQHVLSPVSLITGTAGHAFEKMHHHFSSYSKNSAAKNTDTNDDSEEVVGDALTTTTKRPTIIDFIEKFKTKSKRDCGCGLARAIADGIAEHVADKADEKSSLLSTNDELEEALAHKNIEGLSNRSKRSKSSNSDNNQKSSSDTSSGSCSYCSLSASKQTSCSKCGRS